MFRYLFALFLIAMVSCNQHGDESSITANPVVAVPDHAGPMNALDSGINKILTAYYKVHDALVEADSVAATTAAQELITVSDSMDTQTMVKDTLARVTIDEFRGDISAEAKGLAGEKTLTEQRRAFSMITENLYPLLQASKFGGHKVYQIECPMAFNENEAASWLSPSAEVINPYLGKKHPKYAAGMIHCGELKDSIFFRK
jgi:hypothetical protein